MRFSFLSIIASVALSTSLMNASELEFGHGTMTLDGGFVGLNNAIDADVTTFTLKEQHKNIFGDTYFYSYSITWYESDDMTQAQSTLNNTIAQTNNSLTQTNTGVTIPAIDYTLQGIDLNIALGRDLYHKNDNQFFGIGLLVGASFPWIDSDDSSSSDNTQDAIEKSKTELLTFKVGPTFTGSYAMNDYFMVYATASIAYQYGSIKNDQIDYDSNVDGLFYEGDIGLKFQPFSTEYQLTSFITISPKLYFTLGYRYSNWDVNDVNIDIANSGISHSSTLSFNSSIGYFGIGYDLF